jgi:hypothetical protein
MEKQFKRKEGSENKKNSWCPFLRDSIPQRGYYNNKVLDSKPVMVMIFPSTSSRRILYAKLFERRIWFIELFEQ